MHDRQSKLEGVGLKLVGIAIVGMFGAAAPVAAQQAKTPTPVPPGSMTQNVEVVAYTDIGGRPAFKLDMNHVGDKWYLYLGHYVYRGWSVVDVTDPKDPQFANFIKGPDNTQMLGVDSADGKVVASLGRIQKGDETPPGTPRVDDANKPPQTGIMIFDTTKDPVHWTTLGQFDTTGNGTHKNFYGGGKYTFLAANPTGYKGNILVIVDISDPAHPTEVSRWWVPGQKENAGEPPYEPGSNLHGPAYVIGNTAYLPYGGAGLILLDVSDVKAPKLISKLDFDPPFGGLVVHSVLPMPDRGLIFINGEAIAENCDEPLEVAAMVDIKDPAKPRLLSIFPRPVPPAGLPYANFCDKGGRSGPHNTNDHQHNPAVEKVSDLIYLTYFNGGLRIYDISDPRLPREVGYFIPPNPTKRYHTMPYNSLVNQTEEVLVDRRGYIYVTDKNQGIYVLRYTGPRKGAAKSGEATR